MFRPCSTQIPSTTRGFGVATMLLAGRVYLIDVILYVLMVRCVVYDGIGEIPRYMR